MHAQIQVPGSNVSQSRHLLCTGNLAVLQTVILGLQSLEGSFPVLSQIGLPTGGNSICEEPRLPLFVLIFSLGGLVALPFFDLLLEFGRFRVLLALYRTCDASPETLGFIWKLLVDRGNNFGGREKGSEIQ